MTSGDLLFAVSPAGGTNFHRDIMLSLQMTYTEDISTDEGKKDSPALISVPTLLSIFNSRLPLAFVY